jgi:putative hydrolase of the HAD superfamily
VTVTAVIFDYFGTLTPTLRQVATGLDQPEMAAILGVAVPDLNDWWQRTYQDRSTGRTGDGISTLRLLAHALGGDDSDDALRAAQRVRLATYGRMAAPRQDAVAVLTTLREQGLRIGVLSDCSAELPELWPSLPVEPFVDAAVFSSLVGERKPHPKMYATVCERLAVAPDDCLYIGDGGSNELTGATRFGMRAVLIADEDWARGHRFDTDEWHGETIHRLADVPALLS